MSNGYKTNFGDPLDPRWPLVSDNRDRVFASVLLRLS
jgi:hypothetical protein